MGQECRGVCKNPCPFEITFPSLGFVSKYCFYVITPDRALRTTFDKQINSSSFIIAGHLMLDDFLGASHYQLFFPNRLNCL